ncbi:MAG TPA: DUF4249 domain-containing protein [Mucilaginibacter sp.]|jgi:hypothetical protein|nr:DUF4249 domain-containing protein [Mucilaginibacter sp.]
MNYRFLIYLLLIGANFGCKKPYLPPIISSPGTYLVVEGVISSGIQSTVIKLNRTVNLSNGVSTNPVRGAVLAVESNQNDSYPLAETSPGTYVSVGIALDNSKKYRLRIKTADNKQYLSDFVAVVNSPPIDSVYYKTSTPGLTIYADTHDPQNNTRYYRWDYQETWIIHSAYDSYFKSNGDTVLFRDLVNDNIYQCWSSDFSNTIVLNSSAKLSKDIITNNPVTFIPVNSEKIWVKYSVMVKQYALSADAYGFWQNLKKNTEQLGSIFDAQPTQLNGNIHSITNPSEPVIGYISAGNISSQRIFITNQQLPNWVAAHTDPNCQLDTFYYIYYPPGSKTPVNQVNQYLNKNHGAVNPLIPVSAISPPGAPKPIGFTASDQGCVDCTLRGTNKQPAFWK